MHLWPSMRIRDSFKIGYLKKLEWNLQRMNSEKKRSQQSSSNQEKLLDDDTVEKVNGVVDGRVSEDTSLSKNSCLVKSALVCREVLMVLTCCYCCFCCGACVDEDED
ncbi:uncharacterized protein LOC105650901 [Jatropha curcas]|uniref:uncharacterized protein LOC105650901 n=1 Tax=Jatropha curcas TaxID=180498 RepID=UPI0005FBB4B2|nr:uncharacterized protein LOC105650901 [Jatropha curcas]